MQFCRCLVESSNTYVCTYIIGHYNPLARITTQLLTPLILCVRVLIFYMSSVTYNLRPIPDKRFLKNFFMAILFTLRIFTGKLLIKSLKKFSFRISFSWKCLDLEFEPKPHVQKTNTLPTGPCRGSTYEKYFFDDFLSAVFSHKMLAILLFGVDVKLKG